MTFLKKVANQAKRLGGNDTVKAVYIGLAYCCAHLEDGSAGLAFVFKSPGCAGNLPKRPLAGLKASELLDFAGKGPLANTVCLAVANAVFSRRINPDAAGDVIDQLHLEPGTRVGMVGHFRPLVPVIKQKGAMLSIFDIHPDPVSGIHSPDDMPDLLPDCDTVLVTATSIINQTFDDILAHAAKCPHIAVLGPSTPLLPACYEGTRVSTVSGVIARDTPSLIRAVVEAGGTKAFIRYTDKVNIQMQGRVWDGPESIS